MKIKENKVLLECILFGMHSFLAICEVLAYNEKNGNGALIGVIDMNEKKKALVFPLILDGATGTELTKRGMPQGACTERFVLEHPDVITALQQEYIAAGSDAVLAPTFGANRPTLERHGFKPEEVGQVCRDLFAITKAHAAGKLIAGDMSPTGFLMQPFGDTAPETVYNIYREQAATLLDCGVDFADLMAQIASLDGDFRLRFMTSHPKDASRKLFDTMAQSRHVAHQLHLPVQSGNSRVLKEMNRGYTREQYLEKVNYAKSVMPDLVLTSDIIIGFPGETESEAMDTVSLIREVRYDALFTFIYSPRPGTPAAKMPDPATRAEKQVWFDKLCDAQNEISAELHKDYVGKRVRVLVDGESGEDVYNLTSRTAGGRLVHLKGDPSLVGRYVTASITDSNTWALFGQII